MYSHGRVRVFIANGNNIKKEILLETMDEDDGLTIHISTLCLEVTSST